MSYLNNVGWYYDVIQSPVITEKSTRLKDSMDMITIYVLPKFSKAQIRHAFEKIFGVKVLALNVMNVKGTVSIFKGRRGRTAKLKKAILTINDAKNFDFNL